MRLVMKAHIRKPMAGDEVQPQTGKAIGDSTLCDNTLIKIAYPNSGSMVERNLSLTGKNVKELYEF